MGDFSRRDFLRSMGFGAVAFTTAFDRSIAQAVEANNGKPRGIALLGLGRYATTILGPALRETKLCRLTGVITGTPANG